MKWIAPLAAALIAFLPTLAGAQTGKPEWCRALPRPEYKTLERVPVSDPWFEVYQVVPRVFAIYEPHQAEETISYLIVGENKRCSSTPAWASAISTK